MFYRIEILKSHIRQIISTRYRSGIGVAEIELFAEGERKLHDGDGFRLCNLHASEVIEIDEVEVRAFEAVAAEELAAAQSRAEWRPLSAPSAVEAVISTNGA